MNTQKLLEQYPKTAKIIKKWFTEKMIASLQDPKITEDFKEYMMKRGVDEEHLVAMIDVNPHVLFELFDNFEVYIIVHLTPTYSFDSRVGLSGLEETYDTRTEAELGGIEKAFDILEDLL